MVRPSASRSQQFDVGAGSGVTLYADPIYTGQAEFFNSDDPDLSDNAIGAYSTSSVVISGSAKAVLFNTPNYQGWLTGIVTDTPDLAPLGFNDAAASLKVLPYPTGPVSVTDKFDAPTLDPAWNWNAWYSGATYSLTEQPGQFRVTITAGDHAYEEGTSALQRFDMGRGDWTIETHVSLAEFTPDTAYWAGLTVGLSHPQRLFFGLHTGNQLLLSRWGRAEQTAYYEGAEVDLQVSKQGRAFSFAYRATPDDPWQILTTWYVSEPTEFVGLFGRTDWGGQLFKADFDSFSLVSDDLPPTPIPPDPTPDIHDDFNATRLDRAWHWQSNQAGVDHSLTNAPGYFQMTLPAGAVSYDGWSDNAPQLRRVDMAGDWAIQTQVSLADASDYDTCCFHGGLVVGFAPQDYFAYGLMQGRLLRLERLGHFDSATDYANPSIELRVEKTRNRYLFKYRAAPGDPWTIYDTRYTTQLVQWVGLIGRAWDDRISPVTLSYDYFDLTGVRSIGSGLKGEYFNNTELSGAPSLTRIDPQVDFAWGDSSPAPEVNADQFSARWTGQVEAPTTDAYTFHTLSDDGVRLWVNDELVIDNWTAHAPTLDDSPAISLTADQRYTLTLEYFEEGGGADAHLWWNVPESTAQAIPGARLYPPDGVWTMAAWPDTLPADGVTTATVEIDLSDQFGAPLAGLPVELQVSGANNRINGQPAAADEWAAIDDTDANGVVTATLTTISSGAKTIRARVQGIVLPETTITFTPLPPIGLQVLLPNEVAAPGEPGGKSGDVAPQIVGDLFAITVRAVDAYSNTVTTVNGVIDLSSSDPYADLPPTITLESGLATVPVVFNTIGTHTFQAHFDSFDTVTSAKVSVEPRGIGLTGEYFNNINLDGAPALTRIDPQIDFSWGGNPAPEIGDDYFSVRWTGEIAAPISDDYIFRTVSDDGIRVYVDDELIIDNWTVHGSTWDYSSAIYLTAGQRYSIVVEYFEDTVDAEAHLEWSSALIPWEVVPSARLYPASGLWTMAVEPQALAVDDEAGAQVQVNLADLSGQPETNRPVSIQVSGLYNEINGVETTTDEWIEIGDTDAEGLVTATFTSMVAETKVVRARVDNVVLTEREVTFEPGQPIGLQILLPGEEAAPGEPGGKFDYPWDQQAGQPFDLTVRAVDVYSNTATSFTGTIALTTTDLLAEVPISVTLDAGEATVR